MHKQVFVNVWITTSGYVDLEQVSSELKHQHYIGRIATLEYTIQVYCDDWVSAEAKLKIIGRVARWYVREYT